MFQYKRMCCTHAGNKIEGISNPLVFHLGRVYARAHQLTPSDTGNPLSRSWLTRLRVVTQAPVDFLGDGTNSLTDDAYKIQDCIRNKKGTCCFGAFIGTSCRQWLNQCELLVISLDHKTLSPIEYRVSIDYR